MMGGLASGEDWLSGRRRRQSGEREREREREERERERIYLCANVQAF